jgi:hypothetical protein
MKKAVFAVIAAAIVLRAAMCVVVQPSTQRDWTVDQSRLPVAEFAGDRVTVRNIRNFTYRSESDYTPAWYDKTFDLKKLESAWFVVEPFGKGGAAHTFVSFGFGGNEFLAISVEIRKEKGESFSPLKGLMRQYEVMYVIGDERDLIKLRTNYRRDVVYLYPVETTREKMRKMLVAMLERSNKLAKEPEFYNTAINTCTTNLVRHVNDITEDRVPFSIATLLPANSDRLAYDLGLIRTNLPFEQARAAFQINALAAKYADDPEFSRRIRGLPARSRASVTLSREDGEGSQNATTIASGFGRRILRSFAVFATQDDGARAALASGTINLTHSVYCCAEGCSLSSATSAASPPRETGVMST